MNLKQAKGNIFKIAATKVAKEAASRQKQDGEASEEPKAA